VSHRRAGQGNPGSDPLDEPENRAALALFLESIDTGTRPLGGDR
jgi:hypothetical protein